MNENIILITGASSDIGIELIKYLNEDILILAHYNSSSKDLIKLSSQIKNSLVPLQANLTSDEEIKLFLDEIDNNYGVPNKIVHLAAPKFENIRFKDIAWDSFQNEINISLKSLVLILNRFLPRMAKEKRGKIVCMLSSVTLNVPPKALSQYTIIKYALLGLVKSLASEYADKNIQINAISPSMVETKFLDNINEKIVELSAYNHPLKRNAKVEDVAPIIKLLLSEDSDYITGVNLPITGGTIF